MPRAEVLTAAPAGSEPGVESTNAAAVMAFDAIGVPWRIDANDAITESVRAAVLARIEAFDRTWSRFRSDSLVARIARDGGAWPLPAEGPGLFELYRTLYDLTGGRVSPFVGAALEGLGYGAGLGGAAGAGDPVPGWDEVATFDGDVLSTVAPVLLDVGAAGKGLLVDLVTELLAARGVADVTVDASGDLRVAGERRERVALEHPFDPRRAIGIVELNGGALCASAVNRRAWGDGLHHVIDGRTGRPVESVVATWAVAPTAAVADAAATALFFVPPSEVLAATGALGVRMFSDGRSERHRDFPGELFS